MNAIYKTMFPYAFSFLNESVCILKFQIGGYINLSCYLELHATANHVKNIYSYTSLVFVPWSNHNMNHYVKCLCKQNDGNDLVVLILSF